MAFKKLTTAAATKTHGEEDATILDIVLPIDPLKDSSANLLRAAAHAGLGYLMGRKQYTGAFFG